MTEILRMILMPFALLFLALTLAAIWYSRDLGAEARLLEREGVRTTAEITRKWEHVPTRTDSDGHQSEGIPTYYLTYSFADPGTGEVWEDRATVSRQTWDAIAVGEVRELLVVSGRPEVNALFGGQGIARASRQLDTLATWLGGLSLACLVADRWLRRRTRREA